MDEGLKQGLGFRSVWFRGWSLDSGFRARLFTARMSESSGISCVRDVWFRVLKFRVEVVGVCALGFRVWL